MNFLTKEQFAALMTELAVATGKDLDKPTLRVYWQYLKDHAADRLEWTFRQAVKREKYWPSVGKLEKIAEGYRRPPRKKLTKGSPCSLEEAIRDPEIKKDWDKLNPEIKEGLKAAGARRQAQGGRSEKGE